MDFAQLKTEIKKIPLHEMRAERNDYIEVVIDNVKLPEASGVLNMYFGLPAWPSDKKLYNEVKETIEIFGGIIKGQTLYAKIENERYTFAMIWPWQSAGYFTLKIGFK